MSPTSTLTDMKRTVIVFGLIAGVIMSALMAATMPFSSEIGFDRMLIVGYTSMIAAFLLIYFGIRSYRDNVGGGTVSFGKAVLIGFGITLIASICYTATWEVVYRKFVPDFGEKYTAYMLDEARKAGKSDAELLKMKAEADKTWESYKNPVVRAAYTIVEPLPVGLIISLISAAILRRRRNTEPIIASRAVS
jgi:hypothetical protein